jgi:hypothetical protein
MDSGRRESCIVKNSKSTGLCYGGSSAAVVISGICKLYNSRALDAENFRQHHVIFASGSI